MAKLFFRKVGDDTTNRRQVDVLNGVANTEFVDPETPYSLSLRHTGLWADEGVRNKDDYLYLNPSPANYNDRIQQANTPEVDGNVDLTWNKYPNYASISRWRKMQAVVAENQANGHITNYDTFTNFGPVDTTLNKYNAGILLPDGKVLAVNRNASNSVIIDPSDLSITPIGIANTDINKYYGGCLLPNNKMLMTNFDRKYPSQVIDLTSFEFTNVLVGSNNFFGSILLPDGRVLMVGRGVTPCHIFDPISLTLNQIDTPDNDLTDKFDLKILLPNNKVLLIPRNTYVTNIFDPLTLLFTSFGLSFASFHVGVMMADEKILTVINTSIIAKIDTEILNITPIGSANTTINKYNNGILLPDGRVFLISYNGNQFSIFNPVNNSVSQIGPVNNVPNQYSDLKLLPDGRIIAIATDAFQFIIISASDGNYGTLPDLDTCLSAYLNKF